MNDAASTLGHARARRALVCNTILVSVAAGAVLALTASALVRDANAGPPGPSALNMQQRAAEGNTIQAFDSGAQRLELISEIRAATRSHRHAQPDDQRKAAHADQ